MELLLMGVRLRGGVWDCSRGDALDARAWVVRCLSSHVEATHVFAIGLLLVVLGIG